MGSECFSPGSLHFITFLAPRLISYSNYPDCTDFKVCIITQAAENNSFMTYNIQSNYQGHSCLVPHCDYAFACYQLGAV